MHIVTDETGMSAKSTDKPRTYGWTPRKDALLAQLVGAGYSWSVIGTLCGRSRKSAQARWKVLQSEGAASVPAPRKKVRCIRWTQKMDTLLVSPETGGRSMAGGGRPPRRQSLCGMEPRAKN